MAIDPSSEDERFYGARFAQACALPESRLIWETLREGRLVLAATHVVCPRLTRAPFAPTPVEDGFSLICLRRPLSSYARTSAGRDLFKGPCPAGAVTVLDMTTSVETEVSGVIDAIQLYVTREMLDTFAEEHGHSRFEQLLAQRAENDPLMEHLSNLLLACAPHAASTDGLVAEQISLSLLAHFAQRYAGVRKRETPAGGLAPWQERRARELIDARLTTGISITDLAAACRLSRSHFARAFRQTFGEGPHRFLTLQRLARARHLIRTSALPLAEIAVLCGFSDQSHFTRTFTRVLGMPPRLWQRNERTLTTLPKVSAGDMKSEHICARLDLAAA